jgi:hypothetical protein
MSEESKILTIQDILKWCEEQVEQGFELKLCWEGGGDSGWCWLEVDGVQCSQPEAEWLIDKMYDTLDYGSWAGEYTASGEAIYDHTTKEFDGTDYFGIEDSFMDEVENPFVIKIPKSIYFDSLNLDCEGEDYSFNINASVTNGFFSKESEDFFLKLQEEMSKWSQEVIAVIIKDINDEQEVTSAYQEYDLPREDFTDDGEFMVYEFKMFEYRAYLNEPRGININLLEILENE